MARAILRYSLLAAGASLLAGCMSMRTPMTDFATDYNRVIADTRNEMVLLNILRAQHREPTHYSSISGIEGSISISAEAGLEYEYSADGLAATESGEISTPSASLAVASEPSFTIVPLSSEEFVRGVLSPINSSTIALLLSQGWREYILGPLLIERVSCGSTEIRNHPNLLVSDNPGYDLEDFAAIEFDFVPGEPPAPYTLTIDDKDLAALLLENNASRFRIAARRASGAAGRSEVTIVPAAPSQQLTAKLPPRLQALCEHETRAAIAGEEGSEQGAVLHLRSAEGVIYYLGELLRSGHSTRITGGSDERYLFRLDGGGGPASVAVDYRGRRYAIAEQDGRSSNRALQVISLINQLLALQTSNEALARTPTSVRVR